MLAKFKKSKVASKTTQQAQKKHAAKKSIAKKTFAKNSYGKKKFAKSQTGKKHIANAALLDQGLCSTSGRPKIGM